jgi:hypothetical protein
MRHFPAVAGVMQGAEAAAATQPNTLNPLIETLNAVIPGPADPYLISAALIEGLARTVVQKIPLAKQGHVAVEIVRLLRDRLQEAGVI